MPAGVSKTCARGLGGNRWAMPRLLNNFGEFLSVLPSARYEDARFQIRA
jgi:hypothetical protein